MCAALLRFFFPGRRQMATLSKPSHNMTNNHQPATPGYDNTPTLRHIFGEDLEGGYNPGKPVSRPVGVIQKESTTNSGIPEGYDFPPVLRMYFDETLP